MSATEHAAAPLTVPEAMGPPLPLTQAAAAMSMGIFALLMAGVLPVLLGGLVDIHRLSAAELGRAATLEGLAMGLSTGAAGALLKPVGLRPIGAAMGLLLAGLDLATAWASGTDVVLARAAAGVPEGILLWITIGMVARSETPERLAGILVAAMTLAQFFLALLLTIYVLPRFGSKGGLIALAIATLPAAILCWLGPKDYAPLVKPVGETSAPPLRGWAALIATAVFTAAFPAVAVYLQPLAHQAGLDANVARIALTVGLLAQVIGGAAAAGIAGRVHYMPVFAVGAIGFLICWTFTGMTVPAWVFIAVTALAGFVYLFATPFLVPMTIEADPSRRAAVMSGGAQVLGGALGPLSASFVVSDANVHGALYLGAAFLIVGLLMMAGMHVIALRDRAHRQVILGAPSE